MAKQAVERQKAPPQVAMKRTRPRLKKHYEDRVRPKLMQDLRLGNVHEVPRLEKIVLNVGVGAGSRESKLLDSIVAELRVIAGQQPVVTRARKSISNFALRAGMPVGVSVTLRRDRMYEFLDRLLNVVVPRIRDFRGLPTRSFDGRGNYTFGLKEQLVFPEVDYDRVQKVHGMDITVVTTTDKDDLAFSLLKEMGFPFRGETPVVVSGMELSGAEE